VGHARVYCRPEVAEAAAQWANAMVGRPYDWRLILQIRALQLLLGHARVDRLQLPARPENDSLLICSELTIAAYRHAAGPLAEVGPWAGPGAVMASPSVRTLRLDTVAGRSRYGRNGAAATAKRRLAARRLDD